MCNWQVIWNDLKVLKYNSHLFQTWYFVINETFSTNKVLYQYNIGDNQDCVKCGNTDTWNRITECNNNCGIGKRFCTPL